MAIWPPVAHPALLALAENHRGPLLIVAHAGVNRVVLSRLLHQPLQRLLEIPQDYCGVNILSHADGHLQVDAVNLARALQRPAQAP